MKISRAAVLYSALPNLLLLSLFYSLAVHMYRRLGGWPTSIGEAGFPPSLVTHANITVDFFVISSLLTLFAMPIATFICLIVRRYRLIPYFGLYAALFFISWGLMQLAPDPFLYWWRD